MQITITVAGRPFTHDPTDREVAGLAAARERVNADLRPGAGQTLETPPAERPGYVADNVVFLESAVQEWAARVGGANDAAIQACIARCLRSWERLYTA